MTVDNINKRCKQCEKVLENTEEFFYRLGLLKNGVVKLAATCKDCQRARRRYLYKLDPSSCRERHQRWMKKNRANQNKYKRERYHTVDGDVCRSRSSAYAKKNRDKIREKVIERRYGVSAGFIRGLMDEQQGCCAICGRSLIGDTSGVYAIDHNHTTGKVRGLLCTSCNLGIGSFKESEETLLNAVKYLHYHQEEES